MSKNVYKLLKKQPIQARAKATVDIILEATAQLLQHTSAEGLTTAAIAERAGVSVGSIYQYFESKEALIGALVADTTDQLNATIQETLASAQSSDISTAIEPIVDSLLHTYREHPERVGFLFDYLMARGQFSSIDQPLLALEKWLTEFMQTQDEIPQDAMAIRVRLVVHGIAAVLRSTLRHRPDDLHNPVLRDELVRFLHKMLPEPPK